MKIKYQDLNLSDWKIEMISQVNEIVADYKEQGYDLTLRQVYYQFVSRDLLPQRWADKATGSTNNERSYKNLGELVSDGRMAGLISWSAIVDRTRELTANSHWDAPEDVIISAARSFALDKWDDQPARVEVWVEKDALEGVIARPCEALDIAYFSCRGYTSQTAMHDAALRLKNYIKNDQDVYILHLGDHDPSGIDMSRDIEDRIKLFLGGKYADRFEIRRIALNMDQVRQYAPPPNPAKVTDSRAGAYIKTHGQSSWELDALEPSVIDQLIRDEVTTIIDQEQYDLIEKTEAQHKKSIRKAADNWDEVTGFLDTL
jgi:hypothetical protein